MKKIHQGLSESASTLLALAWLLGCGGNLSLGSDASNGGSGGETRVDTSGDGYAGGQVDAPGGNGYAGGQVYPGGNNGYAGGQVYPGGNNGSAGGLVIGAGGYGPGSGGSAGAGYAGSYSFTPGVDCVCDSVGDAVCSGSLSALCTVIPGCKLSLEDVAYEDICSGGPLYARYSAGEHTVISYGIGVSSEYQMVFDTASGDFIGGSVSGQVGLACNFGGKTEFAEGVQVEAPETTCKLCSSTSTCP